MSQASQVPEVKMRSEVRDGMRIDWNAPIAMDDGIVLRADIFRPIADGKYPVIMTYGIYAKGLSFQEGYPMQWEKMVTDYPEILEGSSNKYQNWEVTDPERWVPHGYVIVRVDSRGAGWSPGFMHPDCPREIAISTSASNGRVRSRGAIARWACSASLITPAPSGEWPRSIRHISLRSFLGRAVTIITAIAIIMAASCRSSESAGRSTRS